MRFVGNQYVDDCVAVRKGVFGIADEYSVLDKGDKVHVSIQTAITGCGFTTPKIKKGGELVAFGNDSVDSVIKGRYPIYSNMGEVFAIVTINGDYIKSSHSWSESTRVEYYSPNKVISGLDVNSPTKGTLSFVREYGLETTFCVGFSIGQNRLNFDGAIPLSEAILVAITPHIGSKADFYRARTGGVL